MELMVDAGAMNAMEKKGDNFNHMKPKTIDPAVSEHFRKMGKKGAVKSWEVRRKKIIENGKSKVVKKQNHETITRS